jgi:nucleoside-diphosphate-sugar epimerase
MALPIMAFRRVPEPDQEQVLAFGIGQQQGLRQLVQHIGRRRPTAPLLQPDIPELARLAREKGVSAYVGDGENQWPSVHRLDAARLFRLALEHGAQDGPFHAVAESGIPYREIAEAIGHQCGVPAVSLSQEDALAHFGAMAMFIGGHGPASSARTRERLRWVPQQPGLLDDIRQPAYFAHAVVGPDIFGDRQR